MSNKRTKIENEAEFFGTESVWKILLKISPPVMLSQLVLSLYNIVDSLFVGQYSGHGLTALSVIYPLQLIITALAVGTGVGVNTYMARLYARGEIQKAKATAGTGMVLAVLMWAVFAGISALIMKPYIRAMANAPEAIEYAYQYGMVVCIGSLATFLEGVWSKAHQSHGNMVVPMIAQLAGAGTNILLDWIFIFGMGALKPMGVLGAAIATVTGQFVSAIIVGAKGIQKPANPNKLRSLQKYIFARTAVDRDANDVRDIYTRAQCRAHKIQRRGGYGAGALLQTSNLLLHPDVRFADMYRSRDKLQLCAAQFHACEKGYERRYAHHGGRHDFGHNMFRGVPQDVYRLVFKGRASACDRADGVQNYRHELYSRCVLADDTHVFPSDR